MPLKPALGVRETVAGHRLGAVEGAGGYPPPFQCIPALPPLLSLTPYPPPPPLPPRPCPPPPPSPAASPLSKPLSPLPKAYDNWQRFWMCGGVSVTRWCCGPTRRPTTPARPARGTAPPPQPPRARPRRLPSQTPAGTCPTPDPCRTRASPSSPSTPPSPSAAAASSSGWRAPTTCLNSAGVRAPEGPGLRLRGRGLPSGSGFSFWFWTGGADHLQSTVNRWQLLGGSRRLSTVERANRRAVDARWQIHRRVR